MIVSAQPTSDERFQANLGLVGLIVENLCRSGYLRQDQRDDALQEGRLGLLEACQEPRPKRGNPEETVGYRVELGTTFGTYAAQVIKRKIVRHFGRRERTQAILLLRRAIGWSMAREPWSSGPEQESELLDERLERLRRAIARLEPHLADIICHRFGLYGFVPTPKVDLAVKLDTTITAISRAQRTALSRLRQLMIDEHH